MAEGAEAPTATAGLETVFPTAPGPTVTLNLPHS